MSAENKRVVRRYPQRRALDAEPHEWVWRRIAH